MLAFLFSEVEINFFFVIFIVILYRKDHVDTSLSLSENEDTDGDDDIESPYDRFTPRSLLDRHPSMLRCSPEKVTTTSFMAASKFSVSTPNLTKLIQEDSMFEEERKKHEQKIAKTRGNSRKKLELAPSLSSTSDTTSKGPGMKKLSVPEDLWNSQEKTTEPDQELYGSEEYRQRFQSYNLSRDDSFGAVSRRPQEERRAQYPISMAFADSLRIPGLQAISVDIDIDESPAISPSGTPGDSQPTVAEPEKGIIIDNFYS